MAGLWRSVVAGLAVLSVTLFVAGALPTPASAAVADAPSPDAWNVTSDPGSITDFATSAGRTYAAGYFRQVGPRTGPGALFDTSTGQRKGTKPAVGGTQIDHAISDGAGGFFVSGEFYSVDDRPHHGVARLGADGSVIDAFAPRFNDAVTDIALSPDGETLYLVGRFDEVNGSPRGGTAAIDTSAGSLLPWTVPGGGLEYAVATAPAGDVVYIGGALLRRDDGSTAQLLAVDAETGSPAGLPAFSAPTIVSELAVSPDSSRVYGVTSQPYRVFSRSASGFGAEWEIDNVLGVSKLLPSPDGDRIYVVGSFNWIAGVERKGLAALRPDGSLISEFEPELSAKGGDLALDPAATTLYVAAAPGAIAVDPTTGLRKSWKASVQQGATTLALGDEGRTVFLGGYFQTVGETVHRQLVAFDGSGVPADWAPETRPDAYNETTAVAVTPDEETVLVGQRGSDWQTYFLSALDASTGAIRWRIQTDEQVADIAVTPDGERAYVAGAFTNLDGSTASRLAAVDPATGAVSSWRGPTNLIYASVLALDPTRERLYVGATLGGGGEPTRQGIVALDESGTSTWPTGRVTPDAGHLGDLTLAPDGSRIYFAGDFKAVNGQTRHHAAAVDSEGALTTWRPEPDGYVAAVEPTPDGTAVFLGGDFASAGGGSNLNLALVNATNGDAEDWAPRPYQCCSHAYDSSTVDALAISADGTALHVGGDFETMHYGKAPVRLGPYQYYARFGIANGHAVDLPANLSRPVISGTPAPGETLTCPPGTWENKPTSFHYQWKRDGTPLSGADHAEYGLTNADAGHSLVCEVSASNAAGAASAVSDAVSVPAIKPSNTGLPVISGTIAVGSTVSCSEGSWDNGPTAFQWGWTRDGQAIPNADAATYELSSADAGRSVGCVVEASNPGGAASALSDAVAVPVVKPSNTGLPVISGTIAVGSTVSCSEGSWDNEPTAFQWGWTRDGQAIPNADAATYELSSADAGRSVGCVVEASNPGGAASAVSDAVSVPAPPAPLPPTNTVLPMITRTSAIDGRLSCTDGEWTGWPSTFGFKWYRNNTVVGAAADREYVVRPEDAGKWLACEVRASNSTGDSVSRSASVMIPADAPSWPRFRLTDTTAPHCGLSGRRVQRLGKSVSVTATCSDESVTATVSGTASVPSGHLVKRIQIKKVTKVIEKARKTTLRIKLPSKLRNGIRRALRAHKRVTVKLKVVVRDAAGNGKTTSRTLKLR